MFRIKYCKFSHIDQRNVKEGKGGSYRTKREALSHLRANHFVDYRDLDIGDEIKKVVPKHYAQWLSRAQFQAMGEL